jgi:hypothetical protein
MTSFGKKDQTLLANLQQDNHSYVGKSRLFPPHNASWQRPSSQKSLFRCYSDWVSTLPDVNLPLNGEHLNLERQAAEDSANPRYGGGDGTRLPATSFFSPALNRLFVPARPDQGPLAQILVYDSHRRHHEKT